MMMSKSILKSVVSLAALTVALAPAAAFAAPLHLTPTVHAFFDKSDKRVSFKLHNASGAPVELKVGDQVMTFAADQTMELKLATGTRIVTTTATDKREAGHLICEVSLVLNNATITMK